MENSLEDRVKELEKIIGQLFPRIKKLEIKNEELEKKIASLNVENGALKMHFERLTNDFNKTPSRISTAPNEIKPARFENVSAQIETPPPANSHITLRQKEPMTASPKTVYAPRTQKTVSTIDTPKNISAGEDFLRDYNIWQSKTDGFEKNNARKDFIAKYKVRYFNCVNFNERMNQPKLPPIFEESSASGDYWAIQTAENIFKVVPNVKSYNENYHVARAMCEVFDSNFDAGNYSNIQLERAAEFTNSGKNWTLIRKGKLILR